MYSSGKERKASALRGPNNKTFWTKKYYALKVKCKTTCNFEINQKVIVHCVYNSIMDVPLITSFEWSLISPLPWEGFSSEIKDAFSFSTTLINPLKTLPSGSLKDGESSLDWSLFSCWSKVPSDFLTQSLEGTVVKHFRVTSYWSVLVDGGKAVRLTGSFDFPSKQRKLCPSPGIVHIPLGL